MTLSGFLEVSAFIILTVALSLKSIEIMATSGTEFNERAAGFALNLYEHVVKESPNKNLIMSPLSIYTALGLAYMGAGGRTQEEMAIGLRIADNKQQAAERFHRVLSKYKNNTMLKIANKVYIKSGLELNPEFKETSRKSFRSETDNLDFEDTNLAAETINSWVETKTNKKIQNLIDPNSLSQDTRMILVNAIYFKGFWKHQFKKTDTIQTDFWISETDSVKVDMMSVKEHFMYGLFNDLDATAIELPYKDTDLSMLVILPNQRTGLKDLEEKLGTVDLFRIRKRMGNEEVIVKLPKFKVDFSITLNNVLKTMGMKTMFSDRADFSGLLNSPEQLKVSKVVHKAFIEVNEEGAEAAAATGHVLRKRCIQISMEFSADHPFLFAIIDDKEDTVPVFSGSITHFNSQNDDVASHSHNEL